MKRLTTTLLMFALCAGGAFGQGKEKAAAGKKPVASSSAATNELKQIENDWFDASKAKNPDKLAEILADDWMGIGWDGKTVDKAKALADLKAPSYSFDSVEVGPIKVRFFGNTAVVTGSDTEKSKGADGKDTSGKYFWTDVFVKQNGKWKAVASQSTKLAK